MHKIIKMHDVDSTKLCSIYFSRDVYFMVAKQAKGPSVFRMMMNDVFWFVVFFFMYTV